VGRNLDTWHFHSRSFVRITQPKLPEKGEPKVEKLRLGTKVSQKMWMNG
jgi:hypothetical protein